MYVILFLQEEANTLVQWEFFSFLDIDAVQTVKILRGPTGTLFTNGDQLKYHFSLWRGLLIHVLTSNSLPKPPLKLTRSNDIPH